MTDSLIVNPSLCDVEARNHCALCPRRTISMSDRVPNRLCRECMLFVKEHGWLAPERGYSERWLRYLMGQEGTRRKRRDREIRSGKQITVISFEQLGVRDSERIGYGDYQ